MPKDGMIPYRIRMKEEGRCVYCGARDERTEQGYTQCVSCAEKQKRKYQEAKEEARRTKTCCICGRKDERTQEGRLKCAKCVIWQKRREMERTQKGDRRSWTLEREQRRKAVQCRKKD